MITRGGPGAQRRRAVFRWAAAAVSVPALIVLPTASPAGSASAATSSAAPACSTAPTTSTSGASFSASEVLCRTFFDGTVADHRDFSLTVSDTTELRNGQVVTVSWHGAHPTGAIVTAEQTAAAAQQEYPVVLMECRGTPDQVAPDTCWTATPNERVQQYVVQDGSGEPMWTLDSDGPQPANVVFPPLPGSTCSAQNAGDDEYWVPFLAASTDGGTDYPIGPGGCAGEPPEMQTGQASAQASAIVPSDTTYAKTALDGTGSNDFTIATSETNASLGCSQTVSCSLVVIPIDGINCNSDPPVSSSSPQDDCESQGTFPPGSLNLGGNAFPPALAVTGSYWWSPSNWQRRIAVPLSFATPADVCQHNTGTPLEVYGSELMAQATQQWNPAFCLNPKLFNTNQVLLSEPQAKRTLQQGEIEAAIQGEPPSVPAGQKSYFTTPTVQAPIGVTGFAIAYVIDNRDGTPYTKLQLDPRLLAKLMTESYPGTNNVQSGDAGIAKNPETIFEDPEFLALNPTYQAPSGLPSNEDAAPAATLFSILAQSDVIQALTSYINADPEARAWIDGRPDPWGMVVNPAYKGHQLPLQSWPLLDTSTNGPDYTEQGNPFCLGALGTGKSKEPDRPLIDDPQDTLANVAYNLQYGIAASLTVCNNSSETASYVELGPEQLGLRFLIGLVTLPAAEEFDLQTGSLQTYANPEVETPGSSFGSGRVFTPPQPSSLKAAVGLLEPDATLGSWDLPYGDFHADAQAKGAYPGTMLLSADVPTEGLPQPDATEYGEYLSFAAGAGQTPGADSGQIPAGYLPLTAANGLGAEVTYTKAAAADVAAQNGQVPALVPVAAKPPGHPAQTGSGTGTSSTSSTTATTTPTATASPFSSADGFSSSGTPASESTSGSPSTGVPPTGPAEPSHEAAGAQKALYRPAVAVGRTVGASSGFAGLALPMALLILMISGGWSALMWWRRGRRTT